MVFIVSCLHFADRTQYLPQTGLELHIRDAIKQNESVKLVKFNFHFSDSVHTSLAKLPFTTDPTEIGQLYEKIWAVRIAITIRTKKNVCFVWLYLKISTC